MLHILETRSSSCYYCMRKKEGEKYLLAEGDLRKEVFDRIKKSISSQLIKELDTFPHRFETAQICRTIRFFFNQIFRLLTTTTAFVRWGQLEWLTFSEQSVFAATAVADQACSTRSSVQATTKHVRTETEEAWNSWRRSCTLTSRWPTNLTICRVQGRKR